MPGIIFVLIGLGQIAAPPSFDDLRVEKRLRDDVTNGGKAAVVVYLHASWCKKCKQYDEDDAAFPAIRRRFERDGVWFQSVSVDPANLAKAPSWLSGRDVADTGGRIFEAFGKPGLPAMVGWTWWGERIFEAHTPEEVRAGLDGFRARNPTLEVHAFDGARANAALKREVNEALTRRGKMWVAADEANAELAARVRLRSASNEVEDALYCEPGHVVPANTVLVARLDGDALWLQAVDAGTQRTRYEASTPVVGSGAQARRKAAQAAVDAFIEFERLPSFDGPGQGPGVGEKVQPPPALVVFRSQPPGAEVHLDGRPICAAGETCRRSVRPGEHRVKMLLDGRSMNKNVEVACPMPPVEFVFEVLRPELVRVPAGLFQMGSPKGEGDDDEHPRHWVRISRSLWFAKTEVTQGQFKKVMGKNPSYHAACGDDCPVERVSWYDAVVYCNKLSIREGLEPCYTLSDSKGDPAGGCADDKKWCHGDHVIEKVQLKSLGCNGYRLPTEAEWEYACRAGRTTRFWSGDTEKDLARVAWYDGNSGGKTHPVGEKREPHHPWGLLNMHGNVWEWCNDGARRSYGPATKKNAVVDPATPPGGAWRVIRGGSFGSVAVRARPALRNWGSPQGRDRNRGFRVVRPVVPEPG